MLNNTQFRVNLLRPTLQAIDMWSLAAENLLMGTAMVESSLTYLKQIGGGPAVGLFMMEPLTYCDLAHRVRCYQAPINTKIIGLLKFLALPYEADFLIGNITAAIVMARLKYWFDSEPLPEAADFVALAALHKRVYNTALGATDLDKSTEIFKQVCDYVYN